MPESKDGGDDHSNSFRNKITKGLRSLGDVLRRKSPSAQRVPSSDQTLPFIDGPEVSFEEHQKNERTRFMQFIENRRKEVLELSQSVGDRHPFSRIERVDPEHKFYTSVLVDEVDPEKVTSLSRTYHREYRQEEGDATVTNFGHDDSIGFAKRNGGFEFGSFHVESEGPYITGAALLLNWGGISASVIREKGAVAGFRMTYGLKNRTINLTYNAEGSLSGISFSIAGLENPEKASTQFHIKGVLPQARIAEALREGSAYITTAEIPPEQRYAHINRDPYNSDYQLDTAPDGSITLRRINNDVIKDEIVFLRQIDPEDIAIELFDPAYLNDPGNAPFEADRWRRNPLKALGISKWEQKDLEITPQSLKDLPRVNN